MAIFTPAQLTFNGEEVGAASELIMSEIFSDGELSSIHRIESGIVAKKQIGLVGDLGIIGRADPGCSPTSDSNNAPVTQKFWDPKSVFARIETCWKDWLPSFFAYTQKLGINRSDITNTDAIDYITELLLKSVKDAMWRIAWFGDENEALVTASPAGNITAGQTIGYHTILDGFWPQIFDIVTADSDRRYTITENAQSTYSTQLALAADKAQTVFENLLTGADMRLRRSPNLMIVCTQTLADNYAKTLEGKAVSESFTRIEDGFDFLRYRGIPVIPIHYWDKVIQTYFDNGTKYYLPHRAVLMEMDNMPVGLEDTSAFSEFMIHNDPVTRKVYTDAGWYMDVKVLENYRVQAAY